MLCAPLLLRFRNIRLHRIRVGPCAFRLYDSGTPTVAGMARSSIAVGTKVRARAKIDLAESAALNPTGDLTNAQFPMLNSHPKWMSDCQMCGRFSFRMRIENWELNIGQIPVPLCLGSECQPGDDLA
jgi:hypothetical protein